MKNKKIILSRSKKERETEQAEWGKYVEDYYREIKTCPVCGEIAEDYEFSIEQHWWGDRLAYRCECQKCEAEWVAKRKSRYWAYSREGYFPFG